MSRADVPPERRLHQAWLKSAVDAASNAAAIDLLTIDNLETWYATRAEHDDRLDLSIIEWATGEWAGRVVLNDLSLLNESCGSRILLQGPRFYGRGLRSEATRLVIDYAKCR